MIYCAERRARFFDGTSPVFSHAGDRLLPNARHSFRNSPVCRSRFVTA